MAVGAFSFYEAVGEEAFVVFAVGEDYRLGEDVSVPVDFSIEFLDEGFVGWAFCSCVVVEPYVEGFEGFDEDPVILVGELSWCYAEPECFYLDGGAVFVASADEYGVFSLQSEVSGVDVRGEEVGEGS